MRTLRALDRHHAPILLLLTGAALLRISLTTDLFLRYVKQSLRPELVAAGVLLVLLGVLAAVAERRHAPDAGDAHGHAASGRLAWLLALPALLLLTVAPPSLGAFTVARDGSGQIARQVGFDPLPPTGTLRLTLSDFDAHAVWDTHDSLKGRTVQLLGFAAPGTGGSWRLSRILVSCCAADARVVAVTVDDLPSPPADTWVTVTGVWNPADPSPTLDATSLARVPTPADPYRDTHP